MFPLNRNLFWATALVEELGLCGVRHVCVSPGSRSAPLALAFTRDPRIVDHSLLDERASAFFALGLARASASPVALVCTSGTASANFLPALVEAHYGHVPIVVLTADRPPEDLDCGAGQTIDQVKIYGSYVRLAVSLPTPALDAASVRNLRRLAVRAATICTGANPGPVHLNVPFREPLAPTESRGDQDAMARLDPLTRQGRGDAPFTRVTPAAPILPPSECMDRLAAQMRSAKTGWLVAGPLDVAAELPQALADLAAALDWPVLADPLSQLRSGPHDRSRVIDCHDVLLRNRAIEPKRLPRPQMIVRFGAMPTSKAFRLLLERDTGIRQIVIDPYDWREPSGVAEDLVRASPLEIARALAPRLHPAETAGDFRAAWTRANLQATRVLQGALAEQARATEPGVAHALGSALPEGATLFSASSMPIRDLDSFWRGSSRSVRVFSNRGANGIDGTVSCALGTSLASRGPLVLLIGDLALLHDASGLLAAANHGLEALVIVLDNGGGGIFEFLPVAQSVSREIFERHLAARHGIDLERFLAGCGFACRRIETAAELQPALHQAMQQRGIRFLRIPSDRRENFELHRKLIEAVGRSIGDGESRP